MGKIAPDLLKRNFEATRPNQKWVTDVTEMLQKAVAEIPDGVAPIQHSDQGWQYQHKDYQKMLKAKGLQQSMSRRGNCLDNAVVENFFGLLKSELLYLQKFECLEQFEEELVDYLDYYNYRRIKVKLKGLPLQFTNKKPSRLLDLYVCLTFGVHFTFRVAAFLWSYFTLTIKHAN